MLILGTHRSGTSVLAECLAEMGLFLGARRDSHHESTFHQRLARRLSFEAGGQWSQPAVVAAAVAQLDPATSADLLRRHLDGFGSFEYWGARWPSRRRPMTVWGWKDPRSGYLLPLWQAVYPQLRCVLIRRDRLECAESLHRRSLGITAGLVSADRSNLRLIRDAVQGHPLVADAWRAQTAAGALAIVDEYDEIHRMACERMDDSNCHTIDYSDLLRDPAAVLEATADWVGLDRSATKLATVAGLVRAQPLDRESTTWKAILEADRSQSDPEQR